MSRKVGRKGRGMGVVRKAPSRKEKTENKSPTKVEEHHEEHHEEQHAERREESHVEHHKAAAPPPPAEPAAVIADPQSNVTEIVMDEDLQALHRTKEPDAIPIDAVPSQSRYD
ncbi:unnamed protein product [Strongylus vulgaris]|uniref:Uncharacterized protein n=1 Tax=Strongylus vulgaris TaxID=40348 RepID=A0A3P7JP25_STRVU|nr:unnamed protein product [Strongylus vulgaris]